MRKIKIALLAVLLAFCLVGCNKQYPTYEVSYHKVIPAEARDAAAKWVLDTVGAANPHSDEEPEDNIKQAQYSALVLFGELTIGLAIDPGKYISPTFIPYDKCSEWQKAIVDEYRDNGPQH